MEFLRRLFGWLFNEVGATLNVATKTNWDAIVPEYWDKAIMAEADREALFSKLSGNDGSDAPVLERMDLTRQKGDKITFSTLQRLLGAGVSGTTALEGSEEKQVPGTYNVTVELYRHATAADEIATVEALHSFPVEARRQLSDWLQRFLDDQVSDQVLNQDTVSTLYAGGKTSRGDLAAGDTLLPHELRRIHMAGQRRGVKPFRQVRGMKLNFPVYGAIFSEVDYYNLVNDPDFRQDVRLAGIRGDNNTALSGAIDMYDGVLIYRWSQVSPGDGMFGSYFRPEARVASALTAAGTTITAGPASAVTNVDYWKYFPTSGTNTLLIGSEQITYASTPGDSTITSVTRGANGTTAATHSAGDLITLNNVGKVLLFGSNFMMRAWAKKPERIRQERDYAMELGLGIKFINGVKTVLNADSTAANAVVMETYSPNPNTV